MRTSLSIREIYNYIQELLIIKTGLYLNDFEINKFINDMENNELSKKIITKDKSDVISLRPEEAEELITHVRYRVGNMDDEEFYMLPLHSFYMNNNDKQEEIIRLSDVFGQVLEETQYKTIDKDFIEKVCLKSNVSRKLVYDFVLAYAKVLDRSTGYLVPIKEWDGTINLKDLFQSEKLPNLPNVYFDQRYIDYLCRQIDDLDKINWRQFEGLTAEFFKREGFKINLGTGRKDGGIDIFLYGQNNELIIVQCKRYKKDNYVKIEHVKALYFDIEANGAESALLATTSYLTDDGKKICSARHYNINAAEHDNIIQWLKKMETKDK